MIQTAFEQYLRELTINIPEEYCDVHPYNLKAIRDLGSIEFHPNCTFIVGENGSGKSTLLEAIAVAAGFNPEGGSKNFSFSTFSSHSDLWEKVTLSKGIRRPKTGYFLRAESFYNVASNIEALDSQPMGGPKIIDSYGGVSLHHQSHGESFMSLMINRFGDEGLYVMDEPEAALSINRQMAMISRLHELVAKDSQFVIATHSPVLLAYPNAIILNADDHFRAISYKDTEQYQLLRGFLEQPEAMMKILCDKASK